MCAKVAKLPPQVNLTLEINDLLLIQYRTKNSKLHCMFSEHGKSLNCCLCGTKIGRGSSALAHILGKPHANKVNNKIKELSYPGCCSLQLLKGSMHEKFIELLNFLSDPPSHSVKEFNEAMKLPIDELLKIEFCNESGEWGFLLTLSENYYVCNLCDGVQLDKESIVRKHLQSASHLERGKLMLNNYEYSFSSPTKTASTVQCKETFDFSEKQLEINKCETEIPTNANAVEHECSSVGNITKEDNKSLNIGDSVSKVTSKHVQKRKNSQSDLDCARPTIREKENVSDECMIYDMTTRSNEKVDKLEKMKINQMTLMQSIKTLNARLKPTISSSKAEKAHYMTKHGGDLYDTQIRNYCILKPKNSWNILSSTLTNAKTIEERYLVVINNENASPMCEENVLRVLRHISAIENVLGSLGPPSTELHRKTLKLSMEGSSIVFSTDDFLLLETVEQKLLGLIEMDTVGSKKISTARQVLMEIQTFLNCYK